MPTKWDPVQLVREDPIRPNEGVYELCGNIVSIDEASFNVLIEALSAANDAVNLTVNPCSNSDQVLPITNTASSFSGLAGVVALEPTTTHVEIRVEIGPVRMAYKGTATIGTNPPGLGRLLYSGDSRIFRREIIDSASFISNTTSVTAYIQVSELIYTPVTTYTEPPC